jgi:hypothetical protein
MIICLTLSLANVCLIHVEVKYHHWLNKTLYCEPITTPTKLVIMGNVYGYQNDWSTTVEISEHGTGIERQEEMQVTAECTKRNGCQAKTN